MRSFEREWKEVHEGLEPETGLKVKGRVERKEVCEDVKLKNRERGLFLVADGVSTAKGWLAARETARVMYEKLGEELDRGIENNLKEARRAGEQPLERLTKFVALQMIAAVEEADSRIRARGIDPEFVGSATTLSLAKLVELPDGKGGTIQRLFFVNVGDSRIYIQHKNGRLRQMTRDDNLLEFRVDIGELTAQEAREIDQAPDPRRLDARLRAHVAQPSIITKSIGGGDATVGLKVRFLDVQPGTRLVIVSDGVSDQLVRPEIQSCLDAHTEDDQAEGALQQAAMERSLDGTHPRAKGDDISALVHTIEARGSDMKRLERPQLAMRAAQTG